MKNRYLVIVIILLLFITGTDTIARVLPVNEEMEIQVEFILENIEMPDLSGTSEYVVLEDDILPPEYTSNRYIKAKYEVYTYSNIFLVLIPELTINNTNFKQKVSFTKN